MLANIHFSKLIVALFLVKNFGEKHNNNTSFSPDIFGLTKSLFLFKHINDGYIYYY